MTIKKIGHMEWVVKDEIGTIAVFYGPKAENRAKTFQKLVNGIYQLVDQKTYQYLLNRAKK